MARLRRFVSTLCLALLATSAYGQEAEPVDADKVSNDDPGRPLQMPPATTEVKEAFEDFERFCKRGAWERAFKALYTINDDQARRFVDGDDGFIIPVSRRRREALGDMPPEGRAAYRLFYDAEARKIFDRAQGGDELADLERVYSAYFTASVGPAAADRLGDVYFEDGRFDRAAECWLAAFREHADSEIPPALLATKAAIALHRAGRRSEFERLRVEIDERHGGESLTIGGRAASPSEHVRRVAEEAPRVDDGGAGERGVPTPLDLQEDVPPAWQFKLAESVEAGMSPTELAQWRASPISAAAPAAAVDGSTVYLNYLGRMHALDLKSGKLRWRAGSFHSARRLAAQGMGQTFAPGRYAIAARGDRFWTTTTDLFATNAVVEQARLECGRAEDGEVLWKLSDFAENAGCIPSGPPLLHGDRLYLPIQVQQGGPLPEQWVLALRAEDGRPLWRTAVAVSRQGEQQVFYNRRANVPKVRLLLHAGSLYIDTHAGILARVDADSGALDWGFAYQTDPVETNRYFSTYNEPQAPEAEGETPLALGDHLVFKGAKSSRVYAIDPNRMTVAWRRPIDKDVRLLGIDTRSIYLGGEELAALDAGSRSLRWATRLPGGSYRGRVAIDAGSLWQATPRGVFEIDSADGKVRRIFRGEDLGSEPTDLIPTPGLVLTVSNRAVTAYPRRASGSPTEPLESPRR